jgi:hypothetical protein
MSDIKQKAIDAATIELVNQILPQKYSQSQLNKYLRTPEYVAIKNAMAEALIVYDHVLKGTTDE